MGFTIDWEKNPLIPVVAQDVMTQEVLMLAYMNQEALALTQQTGFAHYYSRSRDRLWKKGETSGHTQKVEELLLDCDGDTLLLKVTQEGVACHTGRRTCFFTSLEDGEEKHPIIVDTAKSYDILDTLYHTIQERKHASAETSYVAKLFSKGENVVEEAGEFCFAIKDKDEKEAIYEAADLFFHTLIALASRNISPDKVRQELARREGVSGIDEKNSRQEK